MCIDASQFRVSSIERQDSGQHVNGVKDENEEKVQEEDLIDFSDLSPPNQQKVENFNDFFQQQATATTNGPTPSQRISGSSIFYDMDPLNTLFNDSNSPSTSSSNRSSNRQSNGSYELRYSRFPEPPKFPENGTKKPSGFSNWEKFE
jgi:hypothetical protein